MVEIYGKKIYHNGYGDEVIAASTPWMDSDSKIKFVAVASAKHQYIVYDVTMYPLDDGDYYIKFYNAKSFIGENKIGRAIEEFGNRIS